MKKNRYCQRVSIRRALPGRRGPAVTTGVASERVFPGEDAPKPAVEVRSPAPSRCAPEPVTCVRVAEEREDPGLGRRDLPLPCPEERGS